MPVLTISYQVTIVYDPALVGVTITQTQTGTCAWNLHFHFYFFVSWIYGSLLCAYWVWCRCDNDQSVLGGPIAASNNCPFASQCEEDVPGNWVFLDGVAGIGCPCFQGTFYGQTELVCGCAATGGGGPPTPPPALGCCGGAVFQNGQVPDNLLLHLTGAMTQDANLAFNNFQSSFTGNPTWAGGFSCDNSIFTIVLYCDDDVWHLVISRSGAGIVLQWEGATGTCNPFAANFGGAAATNAANDDCDLSPGENVSAAIVPA